MATRSRTGVMKWIVGGGAVLFLIAYIIGGFWITGIAALVLLLVMAGGALLNRTLGPPRH